MKSKTLFTKEDFEKYDIQTITPHRKDAGKIIIMVKRTVRTTLTNKRQTMLTRTQKGGKPRRKC